MERKHFLLLILTLAVLSGTAGEVTNSFFIFCKDKSVTPFFFESVEKISQTERLVNGELCQFTEVAAMDTVFTFPTADIDSISFVTPPTIRKANSHELSDELLSYLVSNDSLSLYFSKDTPAALLPEIGDNITKTTSTDLLPIGFLGKVRNIGSKDDCIRIDCDSIGLGDAFVRFYQPGSFSTNPDLTYKSMEIQSSTRAEYIPPKWNDFSMKPISIKLQTPENFFNKTGCFDVTDQFSFGIKNDINIELIVEPNGKYMIVFEDGRIMPSVTLDVSPRVIMKTNFSTNFNLSLSLLNFLKFDFIDFLIPVPEFPPIFRYELQPCIEIHGETAIELSRIDEMQLSFLAHYSHNPNFQNRISTTGPTYRSPVRHTAMFNGGFGLFLGIYTGPYIGSNTPGKKMKVVSFGVQAGYDISWNWRLGLEDFEMAKKSADIFDYYRIHNATETKFVVEPKLEVGPGEKFKFSYGYPFEWPLEPLSLKNIFSKIFGCHLFRNIQSEYQLHY